MGYYKRVYFPCSCGNRNAVDRSPKIAYITVINNPLIVCKKCGRELLVNIEQLCEASPMARKIFQMMNRERGEK